MNSALKNVERVFFSFHLLDDEAPIVTCPDSVPSMNVDPALANASVIWSPLPSAYDVVDRAVNSSNVTCVDSSGRVVMSEDSFRVGTTRINCSVSDAAMNVGSCEFNITVLGKW